MKALYISAIIAPALWLASTAVNALTIDLTKPASRENQSSRAYAEQMNYASENIHFSVTGWTHFDAKYCNLGIHQMDVGAGRLGMGYKVARGWNPNISMMLFEFNRNVSLESISASFNGTDVSLLAYTGDDTFDNITDTFAGESEWANLLNNGWTDQAGSYLNIATESTDVNPHNITSQYWLIGNINPTLGDVLNGDTAGKWAYQPKYFKLTDLEVSAVPLPASAWMFLSGLAGVSLLRRKKKQSQNA